METARELKDVRAVTRQARIERIERVERAKKNSVNSRMNATETRKALQAFRGELSAEPNARLEIDFPTGPVYLSHTCSVLGVRVVLASASQSYRD